MRLRRRLFLLPAVVFLYAPLLSSCDSTVEPVPAARDIDPGRSGEFSLGSATIDGLLIEIMARNLQWQSSEGTASMDVFLKNRSEQPVDGPLDLVVTHFDPPSIALENPDGYTGDGFPFKRFDVDAFGEDGQLSRGEESDAIECTFDVGTSGSFAFGFRIDTGLGATISGIVFRDDNKNGLRDAGEPGLRCVTVLITRQPDSFFRKGHAVRTNDAGSYRLSGLEAGVYTVYADDPLIPGARATATTTNPLFVTLLEQNDGKVQSYDRAHFGFFIEYTEPRTITVRKDGSGDFTTIGAAVAFAVDGDAIEVGPGGYVEAVESTKHLEIYSVEGPSSTILDGGGKLQILNCKNAGGRLDGFTLRNGWYEDGGGAMTVLFSGSLHIADCIFEDNKAGFQGGAISVGGAGIDMTVTDCVFRNNSAPSHGGAVVIVQGASVTFDGCTFIGNSTDSRCGGVQCGAGTTMNVINCLFVENRSSDVAGAIEYYNAGGVVRNNTLYNNVANRAAVVVTWSPAVTIERNIIVGNTEGAGLYIEGSPPDHSCDVFWKNAGGPINGDALATDDVVADPLFCVTMADGRFRLQSTSPAAPQNSSCGLLVGAFPVGCLTGPGP